MINNQKKINHLNLLKNKNHVWKKKITSKQINQKKKKRIWALDVYKACPVNQKKKRKEKREGTSKGKKNKKGKKNEEDQCGQAHPQYQDVQFFISVFSPFWEENVLVGPRRKHLGPTIYFPSSPPNQTQSKKFSFLFSFESFSSILFHFQTNT